MRSELLLALLMPQICLAAGEVPFFQGNISVPGIKEFIKKNQIKSVNQLLPLLPKELRSNFTLVYRSKSLQAGCVTQERPRVILFSLESRFMMAFTGDSARPECRGLEMLQYDDATGKVLMDEVRFESGDQAQLEGSSNRNPATCLSCHGQDPRPIWGSYADWPGVYGEFEDIVSKQHLLKDYYNGNGGPMTYRTKEELLEQASAFQKNKPFWLKTAPYSLLKWATHSNAPYQPYPDKNRDEMRFRPNLRLTKIVARINASCIARRIFDSAQFKKYKFAVLRDYLACTETIPEELKAELKSGFKEFFELSQRRSFADRHRVFGISPEEYRSNVPGDDRAESLFTDGTTGIGKIIEAELFRLVANDHPELKPYYVLTSSSDIYGSQMSRRDQGEFDRFNDMGGTLDIKKASGACPILASHLKRCFDTKLSQSPSARCFRAPDDAMSALPASLHEIHTAVSAVAKPFAKCTTCHSGQQPEVPTIKFDDPATLARKRSQILYRIEKAPTEDRMPPGQPLSVEEIRAIKEELGL